MGYSDIIDRTFKKMESMNFEENDVFVENTT